MGGDRNAVNGGPAGLGMNAPSAPVNPGLGATTKNKGSDSSQGKFAGAKNGNLNQDQITGDGIEDSNPNIKGITTVENKKRRKDIGSGQTSAVGESTKLQMDSDTEEATGMDRDIDNITHTRTLSKNGPKASYVVGVRLPQ